MKKAAHGGRTGDQCDAARIPEEVTGDSPSEDDSRRELHDPDAGGTGEKVRGAQRQRSATLT